MFTLPPLDETACLSTLQNLVRIKSYSQTSGELEATSHMAALMSGIGLDAEVVPFDHGKRQNAIGVWKGTGGGKRLLFNGHLDTNPVTEGWTVDPWGGEIKDGMIYGIGVSNMKSGCAAYFCAVKTLLEAGFKPRGDVVLTHVVGELQGGVGTAALIEQGRCKADYFVNCEPSDLKAITCHAESVIFRIELTGVTRHMSKAEEATDALLATCDLVPRLNKLTFPNAANADVEACNRCLVGVAKVALGRELADWRPPQVPDFAVLRGSARIGPGQTKDDIRTAFTAAISTTTSHFPSLKHEIVFEKTTPTMPSFQVSRNSPIVLALNKAYASTRPGSTQPTGALKPQCFYGSDAGHLYRKLGMEGVVCGPGGKYNTMPDERVEIIDYFDCIKMFMRLIMDVCG